MQASIHFSIQYDGPALAAHQMDVRDLGPALVALSALLEEANHAAFPDAAEVRVQVQGFKGGSFGIDLIAIQTMAQQFATLLSGPDATAAANLVTLLTGVGLVGRGGVVALTRWLRGRKPSREWQDGDRTRFEVRDGDTIDRFDTDLVTARLYHTRVVRKALAEVLKPLAHEGIEQFACISEGEASVTIQKAEVELFTHAASQPDLVSDTLNEGVILRIESAVFRDGNKWRFNDGGRSFYAEIADPEFLAQVHAAEVRFGKGDALLVDLRCIQTNTDNGLKMAYRIEQVHEHREPMQKQLWVPHAPTAQTILIPRKSSSPRRVVPHDEPP